MRTMPCFELNWQCESTLIVSVPLVTAPPIIRRYNNVETLTACSAQQICSSCVPLMPQQTLYQDWSWLTASACRCSWPKPLWGKVSFWYLIGALLNWQISCRLPAFGKAGGKSTFGRVVVPMERGPNTGRPDDVDERLADERLLNFAIQQEL